MRKFSFKRNTPSLRLVGHLMPQSAIKRYSNKVRRQIQLQAIAIRDQEESETATVKCFIFNIIVHTWIALESISISAVSIGVVGGLGMRT